MRTSATTIALGLSVATLSCGRLAPPSKPEFLAIDPPKVVTVCSSPPCWCENINQGAGYERSQYTLMPSEYLGSGPHLVLIESIDPSVVHVVPDGPCGRAMAANAAAGHCDICVEGRTTEPEMLARTFSFWPGQQFKAKAGLPYLAFQHDRPAAEISPADTAVVIS